MSFQEQERALFDLLFDPLLREKFCQDPIIALVAYDLDDHERNDFKEIRPDAVVLDASMRTYLILTQICRQFPVTFSLISSLQDGVKLLRQLINLRTMRCHPMARATAFASQLLEQIATCQCNSHKELAMITAILEAELGMAWTSTTLKKKALVGDLTSENRWQTDKDWLDKPVELAAYVSASLIPQSYLRLKKILCLCEDTKLWEHLGKVPLSPSLRRKTLENEDAKLFVTRAYVSTLSRCEPTVEHKIAELAEGFAPLLQHVNGSMSINHILSHLEKVGATEAILHGVRANFQQLLTCGMLTFA